MNLALHGFLLHVILSMILDFQNGFGLCSAGEPGYLDFDNLPETNFSCQGKVIGGYYADVEAGCQMFHVCTIGQKDEIMDIKFLCLNGTVFDQETRVCERVDEVDCSKSERFYNLNLELYGNNAVTLSLHEGEDDDLPPATLEDHQHRTSSSRPISTTTTTSRPSQSSTTPSSNNYQHSTGYPQVYQPQPAFPSVQSNPPKSIYDDKNGGYHHQYIYHNDERNNNQATSYQLFSNQGVSSTTPVPQVHQVRYSSTPGPQIIHNEPSTVTPLFHTSSTIQTLLNNNPNGLINPIFHNHGIVSTTEQYSVHSNNPRETSEYQDNDNEQDERDEQDEQDEQDEDEQIEHVEHEERRRLEPLQSTNKGKVSKLTISPVPQQEPPRSVIQTKTSQTSQHHRISVNFLPTQSTIQTTSRTFYPTSRTSSKPLKSSSQRIMQQHIHVPPLPAIPNLKPRQVTINLSPPDIQKIVQNPPPLLPSQSRVIVTAKASVSDESGRPLNTSQLITLPLPTIPTSYDDYKEGDESFDPFYRDVPKIHSNQRIVVSSRSSRSPNRRIIFHRHKRDTAKSRYFQKPIEDTSNDTEVSSIVRNLRKLKNIFFATDFNDAADYESLSEPSPFTAKLNSEEISRNFGSGLRNDNAQADYLDDDTKSSVVNSRDTDRDKSHVTRNHKESPEDWLNGESKDKTTSKNINPVVNTRYAETEYDDSFVEISNDRQKDKINSPTSTVAPFDFKNSEIEYYDNQEEIPNDHSKNRKPSEIVKTPAVESKTLEIEYYDNEEELSNKNYKDKNVQTEMTATVKSITTEEPEIEEYVYDPDELYTEEIFTTAGTPRVEITTTKIPKLEIPTTRKAPRVEFVTTKAPNVEMTTTKIPKIEVTTTKINKVERTTTKIPRVDVTTTKTPKIEITTKAPRVESTTTKSPKVEITTTKAPRVESTTTKTPKVATTRIPKVATTKAQNIEITTISQKLDHNNNKLPNRNLQDTLAFKNHDEGRKKFTEVLDLNPILNLKSDEPFDRLGSAVEESKLDTKSESEKSASKDPVLPNAALKKESEELLETKSSSNRKKSKSSESSEYLEDRPKKSERRKHYEEEVEVRVSNKSRRKNLVKSRPNADSDYDEDEDFEDYEEPRLERRKPNSRRRKPHSQSRSRLSDYETDYLPSSRSSSSRRPSSRGRQTDLNRDRGRVYQDGRRRKKPILLEPESEEYPSEDYYSEEFKSTSAEDDFYEDELEHDRSQRTKGRRNKGLKYDDPPQRSSRRRDKGRRFRDEELDYDSREESTLSSREDEFDLSADYPTSKEPIDDSQSEVPEEDYTEDSRNLDDVTTSAEDLTTEDVTEDITSTEEVTSTEEGISNEEVTSNEQLTPNEELTTTEAVTSTDDVASSTPSKTSEKNSAKTPLDPVEAKTEGVLKFTDEIPREERMDETTVSYKDNPMKDQKQSSLKDMQDYVDDNYESQNYENRKKGTNLDKSGKQKMTEMQEQNIVFKDPIEQGEGTKAVKSGDGTNLDTTKLDATKTKVDKIQDQETNADVTTTSTYRTNRVTRTTTRPTARTTPPKLFKSLTGRKSYLYIPPSTTPLPVVIKRRISLVHPRPAKPIKSYNELAPKPTIRKKLLEARKSVIENILTSSTMRYDKDLLKVTLEPLATSETSKSQKEIKEDLESVSETAPSGIDSENDDKVENKSEQVGDENENGDRVDEKQIEDELDKKHEDEIKSRNHDDEIKRNHEDEIKKKMHEDEVKKRNHEDEINRQKHEEENRKHQDEINQTKHKDETTNLQHENKETEHQIEEVEAQNNETEHLKTDTNNVQEIKTEEEKDSRKESSTSSTIENSTIRLSTTSMKSEQSTKKSVKSMEKPTTTAPFDKVTPSISKSELEPNSESTKPEITLLRTSTLQKSSKRTIKKEPLNGSHQGFNCLGKEMYRFYGDKRDCRLFHYCSPGFTSTQVLDFKFVCEQGTHFDESTQSCRHDYRNPECTVRIFW